MNIRYFIISLMISFVFTSFFLFASDEIKVTCTDSTSKTCPTTTAFESIEQLQLNIFDQLVKTEDYQKKASSVLNNISKGTYDEALLKLFVKNELRTLFEKTTSKKPDGLDAFNEFVKKFNSDNNLQLNEISTKTTHEIDIDTWLIPDKSKQSPLKRLITYFQKPENHPTITFEDKIKDQIRLAKFKIEKILEKSHKGVFYTDYSKNFDVQDLVNGNSLLADNFTGLAASVKVTENQVVKFGSIAFVIGNSGLKEAIKNTLDMPLAGIDQNDQITLELIISQILNNRLPIILENIVESMKGLPDTAI